MAVDSWDVDLKGYDNVQQIVVDILNSTTHNYWSGNFRGAVNIPLTVSSDRLTNLITQADTDIVCDISSYVKNDGTYVRIYIKGSGLTTGQHFRNFKLFFSDGWSGSIDAAIAAGYVDPYAFAYSGASSSSYYFQEASDMLVGGRVDEYDRNYSNIYVYFRPLEGKVLTAFGVYADVVPNSTYDGVYINQSDISKIGLTDDDVLPPNFYLTGTWTSDPIPMNNIARLMTSLIEWTEDKPTGTTLDVYVAVTTDNLGVPTPPVAGDWVLQTSGETVFGMSIGSDYTDKSAWIKVDMTTDSVSYSPRVEGLNLFFDDKPDEYTIRLDTEQFRNAEGQIKVVYDMAEGCLQGVGGPVVSFSEAFTPTDLDRMNNPLFEEHVSSAVSDFHIWITALYHIVLGDGPYPTDDVRHQSGLYPGEPSDPYLEEHMGSSVADFHIAFTKVGDIQP